MGRRPATLRLMSMARHLLTVRHPLMASRPATLHLMSMARHLLTVCHDEPMARRRTEFRMPPPQYARRAVSSGDAVRGVVGGGGSAIQRSMPDPTAAMIRHQIQASENKSYNAGRRRLSKTAEAVTRSPVSHAESSEARKTATQAMSSGCPMRPSGVPAVIVLSRSLPMIPAPCVPSVSTPRRYSIDPDFSRTQLRGKPACYSVYRAFGPRIDRRLRPSRACNRTYVDDAATRSAPSLLT